MAGLWNQNGVQDAAPDADRKAATSKAPFLLSSNQTPVRGSRARAQCDRYVVKSGTLQVRFCEPDPLEILVERKTELLQKVFSVFSSSPACKTLVADLAGFGTISNIVVSFADAFPPSGNEKGGETKGDFLPDRPSPEYQVNVVYDFGTSALTPEEKATGAKYLFEGPQTKEPTTFKWPNTTSATWNCNIVYHHTTPESRMIVTLYHELLHVWFVNKYSRLLPGNTGHRDIFKCEFDIDDTGTSPFHERLKTIYCEMDKREGVAQPPCK